MPASARKARKHAPPKRPAAGADQKARASTQAVAKDAAGSRAKRTRKASRQEVGRQVAQELLKLRPILREVGTVLLDRLDGELAGLTLALDGQEVTGDTPILPPAPVLCRMVADITALKVKPKRGRVKDLRRIEALLQSLSARISPGA